MKWELDDNARSGFHYLVLGVLVVGGLVLMNAALDYFIPGIGPGGSFSHGYAIADDGQRLIHATTTRAERLMTAVLLACGLAFATLLLVRLVLRNSAWARWSANTVFLVALAYWTYAALALPPRSFIGHRDGMFIVWERSTLLHDLPAPGAKHIVLIPFSSVQDVRPDEETGTVLVDLRNSDPMIIGSPNVRTALVPAMTTFATQRARTISAMMRTP